jgi:outer membrane protein assembly factor BamB
VADLVRILVPVLVVAMVLGLGAFSLLQMEQEETGYAPWPMEGGNTRNDCVSPYKADGPPFTLDWELEIESPYLAYPMIMGPEDRMFFRVVNQSTFVNEYIYSVDSEGAMDWVIHSEMEFYNYPIVLGPDLNLYATDGENISSYSTDGQMRWSIEVGPSPWMTVTEDRIYVLTTGNLAALFLNGSQDWVLDLEDDAYTQAVPVVADDGTVHVAYYFPNETVVYNSVLLSVDLNGSVNWKMVLPHDPASTLHGVWFNPVVASDGTVYIYHDGHLIAVRVNGTSAWDLAFEGYAYIAALGEEGTVYLGESGFADTPGYIHAISPDGELLWTYEAPGDSYIYSMVIDEEGTILFGGYGGIFALDPEGNLKWSYEVQGDVTSIVVGEEGAIYFMRYDDSNRFFLGRISGQ